MLVKMLAFLMLGLVAASEFQEGFRDPDQFNTQDYATQEYSNRGACYLIQAGRAIRRSRYFSDKADCANLPFREYGTHLGIYDRTSGDTHASVHQRFRRGSGCSNRQHGSNLKVYFKKDEWTNPPTMRVTKGRIQNGQVSEADPCFDEIILYLPQGSTWTRKYVGAKETCTRYGSSEFKTIAWAEWYCEMWSSCSGVYDSDCKKETFRMCDGRAPFTLLKDTSSSCLYRKPVAQQCKWGNEVKGSIKSANVHRYKDMTITECKAKCEANDLCKSIDFKKIGSGGRGDCNLGNCRMGEGCTNDGDADWIHYSCPKASTTCHNNRLAAGVEIHGNDLELNSLGAQWNMTKADSLKVFFPECEWDQKQVKSQHWEMKNCKCGGAPCNQCGYAELCSEICSQAKECKYVTYHGNHCHPKSAGGSKDRRANTRRFYVSGPPAPMCFVWTQFGIEQATKAQKLEEYGQPKVNEPVSAKVVETFDKGKLMENALKGNMFKKVGCAIEGQITNRATFVKSLWVAFIAVSCAVMQ